MCLDLARAEEGVIKSALLLRIWARASKDAWYKQEQAMYSARRKEVQERRAQLRALLPRAVFTAAMLRAYEHLRTQADPPVDVTVVPATQQALPPPQRRRD